MKKHIKKTTIFTMIIIFPVMLHSQSSYSEGNDFHREFLYNSSDDTNNESIRYTLSPTKSILIGAPVGCFLGILLGISIPASSYDTMLNGFRGSIIGMSIAPFIHYEMARGTKGISNEMNKWALCIGSNLTYNNYKDAEIKPGFSAGMNRYYYLNKRLDLIYSLYYEIYQFKIPDKIIHYSWLTPYKLEKNDIEFSAHYIDILLLFNYKFKIAKTQLNIGIGPFISVQFLDNTKYVTYWEKDIIGVYPDYEYDYYYNDDEVVGTSPYIGYALNLGFVINKFIVQLKYKNAFYKSDHIYALSPSTKLSTIEFTFGIYIE